MRTITLAGPHEVDRIGTRRPVVFLSASIPRQADLDNNRTFAADVHQLRVRSAVPWLCRALFEAGVQVVFGGHPAITPLVLAVARERGEDPSGEPCAFIFQSEAFRSMIPKETYELADWARGRLVWTASDTDVPKSLLRMRQCMVRAPGTVAAIFAGGMDGIFEEERLFLQEAGGPMYALAATGGAAEAVYARDPAGRRGGLTDAEMRSLAWDRVADQIVHDLRARGLLT
jgi:hypothetical protein